MIKKYLEGLDWGMRQMLPEEDYNEHDNSVTLSGFLLFWVAPFIPLIFLVLAL